MRHKDCRAGQRERRFGKVLHGLQKNHWISHVRLRRLRRIWSALAGPLSVQIYQASLTHSLHRTYSVTNLGGKRMLQIHQYLRAKLAVSNIVYRVQSTIELEVLRAVREISLSAHTVIGQYRRYDERVCNSLRDWKIRIQTPLISPTQAHENFLIWAAPGSGKSFFVQEIAHALGDHSSYLEINLARLSREDFCKGLSGIKTCDKPILCLIDEIDARADETWPYEECFSFLDANLQQDHSVVYVLIGSSAAGMEGMIQNMVRRNKGTDLLDRVPVNNRFEIPPLSLHDRVVIVASQVMAAGQCRGQVIREIERLALYYTLKNKEIQTPRQLSDLATTAIQRVSAQDDRLKYDDLFHRGDNRNQLFWVAHHQAAGELSNTYVLIES